MSENPTVRFLLNGELVETDAAPGRLVLDHLRRDLRVVGVKEGCREGDCGACTVLLGELEGERLVYRAVPACMVLVGQLEGTHLVTIEGLTPATGLSPLQRIVAEEGATQCGFCTPGILVAWTAFLLSSKQLTKRGAIKAISGNLCRCTGYTSLRRCARRIAEELVSCEPPGLARIGALVNKGILPEFFMAAQFLPLVPDQPADHANAGPVAESMVIAGGTDLLVRFRERPAEAPPRILNRPVLSPIIRKVRVNDELVLDAMTTFEELRDSVDLRQLVPRIAAYLELIASPPIRARATLGGNIANASPAADVDVMLQALDAELELRSKNGKRRLSLGEFHLGYKETALRPGEVIDEIHLPLRKRRFNFEKVSRRRWLDVAAVNSAISFEVDGDRFGAVTLAVGGVAPIPLRLSRAPARLAGEPIGIEAIEAAAELQDEEIAPIDDVRGSATYKRLLARRLFYAHFLTLLPERGLEAVVTR